MRLQVCINGYVYFLLFLNAGKQGEAGKNNNEKIYFQEHDNHLQKASRNYNSFVKSELFKKFKNTQWVMDLASGKGQDLFRYSTSKMKNVIFLEIDKMALGELAKTK